MRQVYEAVLPPPSPLLSVTHRYHHQVLVLGVEEDCLLKRMMSLRVGDARLGSMYNG